MISSNCSVEIEGWKVVADLLTFAAVGQNIAGVDNEWKLIIELKWKKTLAMTSNFILLMISQSDYESCEKYRAEETAICLS